jgi:hypothetical protein
VNYTSLTPSQLHEIQQANRDMLALSRARHAEHLAQQVADRENAANFGQRQVDAAKTLLARAHGSHRSRRFTGAAMTDFGGL